MGRVQTAVGLFTDKVPGLQPGAHGSKYSHFDAVIQVVKEYSSDVPQVPDVPLT
jgi:hypothetical protein